LYQEAAFRALDSLRPRAVVITSNRRYAERALALAARARGIPCLLFSGMLFVPRYHSDVFDISDRLLVIGSALRDGLVREGVDPGLVTVVGDPRSSAARLIGRARLRAEVWREFGLGEERPLIVLVSKYVSLIFSAREKEALYRTVAAARERLGRPHVIVKAHPNEDLRLLREQVGAWGWPDAIVTQEYDIHRLFGAADAAVMVTSMAGLEAMALDCPVVALQARGKDFEGGNMPPYVTAGAAVRVDADDSAALAEALARLLHDPAARAAQVERGRAFAATSAPPVEGALARCILDTIDAVRATGRR
jgi:glycosyl transferase family 1